jgi:hypothetical protein
MSKAIVSSASRANTSSAAKTARTVDTCRIGSLAAVRRLQVPAAVQVNIGGQHVNVLETGAVPMSADG